MNAAIEALPDNEPVDADEDLAEITLERFNTDINAGGWTWQRKLVAQVISHQLTEVLLAVLVLCSLSMVIIETDDRASGVEIPGWIEPLETLLLLIYVAEMSCRVYVLRTKLFVSYLNIADCLIVLTDSLFFVINLASLDLPNVIFIRIMRLMRLVRAFHILASQQELALMMEGLLASLRTCLSGCVIITVAFLIFGVLAVEFLHPLDVTYPSTCDRCPRAFSSVFSSMITFVQTVVVGDEFGAVFLPIIEGYPVTLIFIFAIFVTVNFGLMNLIMAVIVDSAVQARAHNNKQVALAKQKEFQQNQNKLRKICEDIDSDGGGTISLPELTTAYKQKIEFQRTLNAMDLEEEDLVAVFNILDEDNSGDVKYDQFVQHLWKMKSNNTNTMLVFIKHYVTELRKNVKEELRITSEILVKGVDKLRSQVSEELSMIKQTIAIERAVQHHTDLIELETQKILKAGPTLQAANAIVEPPSPAGIASHGLLKQGQTLQSEPLAVGTSLPPADSMFNTDVGIASVAGAGVQLQTVADQMTVALDALRYKIESSAALLNKFQNSLPCSPIDLVPQCIVGSSSKAAADCASVQPVSVEPSKSVCTATPLAQSDRERTDREVPSGLVKRDMESPPAVLKGDLGISAGSLNPTGDHACLDAADDLQREISLRNQVNLAVVDSDKSGRRTGDTDYVIMVTSNAGIFPCVDAPFKSDTGTSPYCDAMLPSSQLNTVSACDDVDSAKDDTFSDAKSEPSHASRGADQPINSGAPTCDLKYSFTFEDDMMQLGIEIYWIKDGLPLVGRVLPKSAANLRGLLPGDRLIECNGIALSGKSREEILQFFRLRPLQLIVLRTDLY